MGCRSRTQVRHADRADPHGPWHSAQSHPRPCHQWNSGAKTVARALQHRTGFLGLDFGPPTIVRRFARSVAIGFLALLFLIAMALVATQTGLFKNYLRRAVVWQASEYLNGALTIDRLEGSVLTGVVLKGVALHHENQTPVAVKTLTLRYDPFTMIRSGLILASLTLDQPTISFERDSRGWNFSRFVKTRQSAGGGSPPITIEALTVNDGRLIVRDNPGLVEDVSSIGAALRFAYYKPGVELDIGRLSARTQDLSVHSLSGQLRFEGGGVRATNLNVQTDRSDVATSFVLVGGSEPLDQRHVEIVLHAGRLSLDEAGRFYAPISGINLDPAVDLEADGTLAALKM